MSKHQSVCLRRISENRAGERMMGRFFDNEDVTIDVIKADITDRVSEVCEGRHVLSIQDTTEINHFSHVKRVRGLGPVRNPKNIGFFLHPHVVVDADEEICLGISSIHTFIRPDGKKVRNQAELIETKESYRWIESAQTSKETLQKARMVTIVADRESDIYEEYVRLPDDRTHLLTRASHNRYLANGQGLFEHVASLPNLGFYEVSIKKTDKRSPRKALMNVKYGCVTFAKPVRCTDKMAPDTVSLFVVDVCEDEKSVPPGEKPIHWCLITTHKISCFENACQIVRWYQNRWHSEQIFRTLKKQGLDVESSQLEKADNLIKLTCMALQIALQTMQLTLAREGKDQSITVMFNASESKALKEILKTVEGKTEKQKNPYPIHKLSWAAWIIARLGGWKGYQSESPPGPITMRNGLDHFKKIYEGILIAQKIVCID